MIFYDFFELGLWGNLGSRRDTVRGLPDSWPGVGVPGINGAGAGQVSMYQAPLTRLPEVVGTACSTSSGKRSELSGYQIRSRNFG